MNTSSFKRPQTVPNDTKFAFSRDLEVKDKIYKDNVFYELKLNNDIIDKSDNNILFGKTNDPLTNLRDVLRTLSNKEAFRYMRQCRLITAKLRKCWVDVNEEIKSLAKNKEYLESAIEHLRKDIIINKEITDGRIHKSVGEPNYDYVDDSLVTEKQILLKIKKDLEQILKPVQQHLFKLDETREKVFKLCNERARVTDLLCQCLTQSMRIYDKSIAVKKNNSILSNSLTKSFPNLTVSEDFRTDINSEVNVDNSNYKSNDFRISALNAFTNENIDIIKIAFDEISYSQELRLNSVLLVKESIENSKKSCKFVDETFMKKINDTILLSQSLSLGSAENNLSKNRSIRWHALTDLALKYSIGTENLSFLQTSEKMNRPIIRSYQKHPGNQVPEINQIIQGTKQLISSIDKTTKVIGNIKIIGKKLDGNTREKEVQLKLDTNLLRRRRELSGHKWTSIKHFKQ